MSGLANNIVGTCIGVHLLMFYTDIVGLSPLWVSAGLVVAVVWDAVSDLAMGHISDGTRWKSGRRRPFILIGMVPAALAFGLLLSPPAALEGSALGVYFIVVLLALFTAKTIVQVPALSLLPEMATGYDERTKLASARELLGNVGDLLGLMLPPALLIYVGFDEAAPNAGEVARGAFSTAAWIGAGIMLLALLATYFGTKENRRVHPEPKDMWKSLAALRDNHAFRTLLTASALAAVGLAFVNALVLYVFVHVLEFSSPVVHMSAFAVNAGSAIASYPFWNWLARTKGKPFAFRGGLALSMLVFVSVFIIGPGNLVGLYAVMVVGGVANVGFWMLMHTLSADIVDLDELATGERREGLFAGFSALLRKGATALAAAGVGVGLFLIDYQAGAGSQTAETVFGLKLLFAVPPTVLLTAALLVFRRFRLTREAHAKVLETLAARATIEAENANDPSPQLRAA